MSSPACLIRSAGVLIGLDTLLANGDGRSVLSLNGCEELDAPGTVPVVVPVHKICKAQEGLDLDAQLLGNLSHALPRRRTHPPFHISFDRLVVTTHCSAQSSARLYGCGGGQLS